MFDLNTYQEILLFLLCHAWNCYDDRYFLFICFMISSFKKYCPNSLCVVCPKRKKKSKFRVFQRKLLTILIKTPCIYDSLPPYLTFCILYFFHSFFPLFFITKIGVDNTHTVVWFILIITVTLLPNKMRIYHHPSATNLNEWSFVSPPKIEIPCIFLTLLKTQNWVWLNSCSRLYGLRYSMWY